MKLLIFVFIIILSLVSCNLLDSNNHEIDSKLIGEWVYKEIHNQAYGPKEFISGIQIRENGQVYLLGIETSTGKLKLDSDSIGIFLSASDNSLVYENHQIGMLLSSESKGNYIIRGDSLFLFNEFGYLFDGKYKRAKLNTIITSPVKSQFSININGEEYLNEIISRSPSAYAYLLNNKLYIISRGNNKKNKYNGFHIEISNYTGFGEYDISSTEIFYEVGGEDVIIVTSTEFDSSQIYLKIETIDDTQISGKLDFKIAEVLFSNGIFDVPVY